jgi:hypothetical protein
MSALRYSALMARSNRMCPVAQARRYASGDSFYAY